MKTFTNNCYGARPSNAREFVYLDQGCISILDPALGIKIKNNELKTFDPNYMNVFHMMTQSAKQSETDVALMKEMLRKMKPAIRTSAWARFCANELKRPVDKHAARKAELLKVLNDLVGDAGDPLAYKIHDMKRPAHPGACDSSNLPRAWFTAKFPIAINDHMMIKPGNYVHIQETTHYENYLYKVKLAFGTDIYATEIEMKAGNYHHTMLFPCELIRY